MPIKIGLIGKTNTGKTTFFNSATLSSDEISTYPFTTKKSSISVGIAGIFIETHDDPDNAPSDGPNMLHLNDLKELILKLKDFDNVAKS